MTDNPLVDIAVALAIVALLQLLYGLTGPGVDDLFRWVGR